MSGGGLYGNDEAWVGARHW